MQGLLRRINKIKKSILKGSIGDDSEYEDDDE